MADVTPKPAQEALRIFFEVRGVPGLKKKPSTSELLDWLKLLLNEDITRATSDFLGRPDDEC